jgi:hypothetical protein
MVLLKRVNAHDKTAEDALQCHALRKIGLFFNSLFQRADKLLQLINSEMALNQRLAHAHDHLASSIEGTNTFLGQWSVERGSSHGLKKRGKIGLACWQSMKPPCPRQALQ